MEGVNFVRDLIVSLFGAYTPVTYTMTSGVPLSDGTVSAIENIVIPAGLAGVDWTWVAGVFLFAIVLHGFLRMVGVLLKNG